MVTWDPNDCGPKVISAGYTGTKEINKYDTIVIQETLFIACKPLIRNWISALSPTKESWISKIKIILSI